MDELGVCLAAVDGRLDGIHGGKNAGRCCWVVAGTFCDGQVQGTFAQKQTSCEQCAFFKRVHAEEGARVSQTNALLSYLSASHAAERRRYNQILGGIMDPSLVPLALADLNALKRGATRHVTAFFSDIVKSSRIAEQLQNSKMAAFLNEYFSAMTDVLKAEGGTIDKYVGDAMVGIFGAPVALNNDAQAAARAALRMLQRLGELKRDWRRRRAWCPAAWSLRIRIGLSSGRATVGFIGTRDLASYTMIGPVVNAAKYLEEACESYGVSVLVSEATRELLADEMVMRRVDQVCFKGCPKPEAIYELLGDKTAVSSRLALAARVFEAGRDAYDDRRWAEAAGLLRKALKLRGKDPAALRLLRSCDSQRTDTSR